MSAFFDTVGVGKGSLNSTEHRPSQSSVRVRRHRSGDSGYTSHSTFLNRRCRSLSPSQYSRPGDAATTLYLPMLAPTVSPPRFFLLWVSPSSWVLNVSRNIPRLRVAPDCWKSLQEVAVLRRESVYCRTRRQCGGVTSAAAIAIPKSAVSTLQVSHAQGTIPPPPHTPAHTAGTAPQQRQAATRITGSIVACSDSLQWPDFTRRQSLPLMSHRCERRCG